MNLHNDEKSQFALLSTQRFAPFFWTQFLGAFNDNVFKNALILLIAYRGKTHIVNADVMINAAAGLFILPFFLFSATAGQFADKYEKSIFNT
jgi:MFS family permease